MNKLEIPTDLPEEALDQIHEIINKHQRIYYQFEVGDIWTYNLTSKMMVCKFDDKFGMVHLGPYAKGELVCWNSKSVFSSLKEMSEHIYNYTSLHMSSFCLDKR